MRHSQKTRKQFTAPTVICLLAAGIAIAVYDPNWTKSQCDTYSYHGLNERYVYGGNKGWIDNDTWDASTVEGVDCASYVCRCLALPQYVAETTAAPYPYTTVSLYAGVANTTQVTSINELQQWDLWVYVFGSSKHTGLFKQYSGTYIITREARSADSGVVEGRFSKQYLIDKDTRFWRRANWSSAPQLPTVQTLAATDILLSSATLNASITNETGMSIDEMGFAWGSTESCSDGWVAGTLSSGDQFSGTLTGLGPSVTYYFMAKAHTIAGWISGAILSFKTNITLYVDQSATGNNNGTQWTNAYTDLQEALAGVAGESAQNYTIYIAKGTYSPGNHVSYRFTLPANISVYGGFPSGGCDFVGRNPARYKTILSGGIDETRRNETIVTMGSNTVLNGVLVTGSSNYGVYGLGADFIMEHCAVLKNEGYGIYAENATPRIKNCIVSGCAQGIKILNPIESPVIYNNTIILNNDYGVSFSDNHNSEGDPNYLDYPNIQNCIIYYNNSAQLAGVNPDTAAAYCCVQDCNELWDITNINDAPQFAYACTDPNTILTMGIYHLVYSSPCKDAGNPALNNGDVGVYDMDYRERIVNNRLDIGADEIDCDNVSNPLDSNADGLVNHVEFNRFSQNWRAHDPNDPAIIDPDNPSHDYVTDPNSPGYINPNRCENWCSVAYRYNLATNGDSLYEIDLADLIAFCQDDPQVWLWTACWK